MDLHWNNLREDDVSRCIGVVEKMGLSFTRASYEQTVA
jgi:hypothetical protein